METQEDDTSDRHMNDTTLPPETLHAVAVIGATAVADETDLDGMEYTDEGDHHHHNRSTTVTTTATTAAAATSSATTILTNDRSRKTRTSRVQQGFGLADWTRLVRSAKDLAQRHGQDVRRNITREEVAQHKYEYDAWIILHNKVYNIGPYLPYHPGGVSILKSSLGKDASALFDKYHRWVNVEGLIGSLLLGYLDLTPRSPGRRIESGSYLPHSETSPRTKDGFAIPAPRPRTTRNNIPSSLLLVPDSEEEEEEEENNPLEYPK